MMKAIEIKEFGAPDSLKLTNRPMAEPSKNEVLIKVHAAGVNRPDLLQRLGKYPPPPGASDLPGLEVAGEIVKSISDRWRVGDKVCALLPGGGYAEYAVAHEGSCLKVPDGLNMIEAASLPETFFTVWNNLFIRGELKKGECVLIHGGASGIGVSAIQMAKAWGASVIITAGSSKKCEACLNLGADKAVNYKTEDFSEAITGGVDVVLDMVGGDYFSKNLALLNLDGRHISIAHLNGAKAEVNINLIMRNRLKLTGSTLRPRSVEEKEALASGLNEHIWPFINKGKIKPVIHKVFNLEEASRAHEALENGDHIGKIILKVL
jgi:NADPH2:quinone reductase